MGNAENALGAQNLRCRLAGSVFSLPDTQGWRQVLSMVPHGLG